MFGGWQQVDCVLFRFSGDFYLNQFWPFMGFEYRGETQLGGRRIVGGWEQAVRGGGKWRHLYMAGHAGTTIERCTRERKSRVFMDGAVYEFRFATGFRFNLVELDDLDESAGAQFLKLAGTGQPFAHEQQRLLQARGAIKKLPVF